MRLIKSQAGFTLLELLLAITIMALASGAAGAAIFQVMKNTEHNSDRMTVARQVQNAGAWISHDTLMATSANATNSLSVPDFLILNWIEWDASGNPVYHTVRYYFDGLSNGTGTLMRNHWSTTGTNENALIAQYIYYELSDVVNTSNSTYQFPMVTVKLTAILEDDIEKREYRIRHRPVIN